MAAVGRGANDRGEVGTGGAHGGPPRFREELLIRIPDISLNLRPRLQLRPRVRKIKICCQRPGMLRVK